MNYQIKSLGHRTDLLFNQLDGSVVDKGEYIVATTTSNPNYFWGNLLLYKKPPQQGDLEKWKSDFKNEFQNPDIYHITLAWDSPSAEEGDCSEFINEGFSLDKSIVLTTNQVIRPRKYNSNIKIKTITEDADFLNSIKIQTLSADDQLTKETWNEFYLKSMTNYKKLIQDGHGEWFGAYLNDILVGSLGLFTDEKVGRFQIVSTHPDYQRQGVCSTLVYEAAKFGFEKMGVDILVMVADEEYHAAKIYESVGFKPNQKQIGLCWWDKKRYK